MEEETIGLGFHSSHQRDAITGVASMSTEAAASSFIDKQHQHATTRFVSSSENSKLMSMFPPPPPHPSTAQQQQQQQSIIQSNDRGIPLHSTQTQQPLPQEMHQNAFPNQQSTSFQPPPGLPPQLSIPSAMAIPPPSQFPPPPLQQQVQSQIIQHEQHNVSIAKARAIAQRFHTESTQTPSYTSSSSSSINNLHSNSSIINYNNSTDNTHNYAQKRQQHFQNEKLKLQSATLKNLEYIMKHEESQLRSHVECMNEMTEWGERQELQLMRRQQQQQQQQQQKQQRQVEQRSGGGIGSKDQRYVERVRKRQQLEHLTTDGCRSGNTSGNTTGVNHQQQQQQQQRTSIYLTNLPTDGSITERTLRSLFCVYGCLDRVTMYRNRSTGELKGDGLIVFGLDAVGGNEIGSSGTNNLHDVATNNTSDSGIDLVETVCMQMNGAELPCGTVIGVEPADMDWGRKDKKVKSIDCDHVQLQQQQQSQVTTTSNSGEVEEAKQSNEASSTKDEEEEDLDDFFASLE